MKVGDFVIAKSEAHPLRSGAEWYPRAVVVSLEPFALVSEGGDMMWTCTMKPEDVYASGPAPWSVIRVAMDRYYRDFPDRKPPAWWQFWRRMKRLEPRDLLPR